MLGPGRGLRPVDGHHVAKVAGDGPPHLALVHDLLLGADLKSEEMHFHVVSRSCLYAAISIRRRKEGLHISRLLVRNESSISLFTSSRK